MIMETFTSFLQLVILLSLLANCSNASNTDGVNSDRPQLMPLILARSYLEGADVNIYCVVASGNRQSLRHEWKKDGVKLYLGSNIRIENQGSDSLLKLYNISSKDAGIYSCAARNEFGQDTNNGTLVINVPSKWIEEPQDAAISAGKDLELRCSARGQPKPDIRWYKRGALSTKLSSAANATQPSKEQSISQQGEFTITSSRINDSGLYECVASNGVDRDLRKVIEVKIQGPPVLAPIPMATDYPEGANVHIMCSIVSGERQNLEYEWRKDDLKLNKIQLNKQGGGGTHFEIETHPKNELSRLTVSNLTSSDAGEYRCVARNNLGQTSVSAKLIVTVEMRWLEEPNDIDIGLGQKLSLKCSASGHPEPRVQWRKLRQPFTKVITSTATTTMTNNNNNNGNTSQLEIDKGELTVGSVALDDAGIYECTASNGADEDLRKVIKVNVQEPPQLLPIVLAKSYKEGANVNLFCSLVEGDRQSLSYEWLKDNQRLKLDNNSPRLTNEQDLDKSILKVSNVQAHDSGNYTCLVRNRYGKDSATGQLLVKVDLKWIQQPEDSYDVGLGRDLIVNCQAQGQPNPTVKWFKLSNASSMTTTTTTTTISTSDHSTFVTSASDRGGISSFGNQTKASSGSRFFNGDEPKLRIMGTTLRDSGIYECIASNGAHQELRKIFKVNIQAPANSQRLIEQTSSPSKSSEPMTTNQHMASKKDDQDALKDYYRSLLIKIRDRDPSFIEALSKQRVDSQLFNEQPIANNFNYPIMSPQEAAQQQQNSDSIQSMAYIPTHNDDDSLETLLKNRPSPTVVSPMGLLPVHTGRQPLPMSELPDNEMERRHRLAELAKLLKSTSGHLLAPMLYAHALNQQQQISELRDHQQQQQQQQQQQARNYVSSDTITSNGNNAGYGGGGESESENFKGSWSNSEDIAMPSLSSLSVEKDPRYNMYRLFGGAEKKSGQPIVDGTTATLDMIKKRASPSMMNASKRGHHGTVNTHNGEETGQAWMSRYLLKNPIVLSSSSSPSNFQNNNNENQQATRFPNNQDEPEDNNDINSIRQVIKSIYEGGVNDNLNDVVDDQKLSTTSAADKMLKDKFKNGDYVQRIINDKWNILKHLNFGNNNNKIEDLRHQEEKFKRSSSSSNKRLISEHNNNGMNNNNNKNNHDINKEQAYPVRTDLARALVM